MKIIFYINTLEKGGAERVVTNLANDFADNDHEIYIVTTYKGHNEYSTNSKVNKICIENFFKIPKNNIIKNLKIINRLNRIIRTIDPDIVVSFMREPNVRLMCATLGLNTKTIVSVRNDPKKEYPGFTGKLISKYILPKSDGCVFQTNDAKSYFPLKLQIKSKVIFNQVSNYFFEVERNEPEYIVSLGRLTPQKNHALLIDAFQEVNKTHPNEKLLIYGEGELQNELMHVISENKLEDKIFLMGNTNNVPEILSKAKMFVLTSNYEGMPNALLEALAVGVPCISTDCPCGGPKEVIINGENGFLFPVGNKKELVRKMKILLDNQKLANKIGNNAKIKAKIYNPENIYYEWNNYLEKVINLDND